MGQLMTALSIIIPCYNERANLPLLLDQCAKAYTRPDIEVILVDNGSIDETASYLAQSLTEHAFARSIRVPVNRGYGHGIIAGLREAKGDVLSWTHADMQTNPGDVLRGLALFERARDPTRIFVKGLRYGRPIGDGLFTTGMSAFETVLLCTPMRDINAQPTMFPQSFFTQWQNPPDDFSLDLYAYFMAHREGLEIKRFPVLFGKRASGMSHWNISPSAKYKFIRRTIQYSLKLKRELK